MKTLFVVTRIKGAAWDSTRPVRSQEQWSQHAEFMDGLAAHGFIVLGGPIGADEYFVHVVNATHEEQVRGSFCLGSLESLQHSRYAGDPPLDDPA